jgi:hypothetical protein
MITGSGMSGLVVVGHYLSMSQLRANDSVGDEIGLC